MTLPDCLTADEFGGIRLAGTRIGLSQFMGYHLEGQSAEGLVEQFPQLGLAHVHSVLAYYWANRPKWTATFATPRRTWNRPGRTGRPSMWPSCGNAWRVERRGDPCPSHFYSTKTCGGRSGTPCVVGLRTRQHRSMSCVSETGTICHSE